MKQRHDKMQRLVQVQQKLQTIAELRLIELQRQETDLKVAQEAILQSMNGDDRLHGLFVDVMAKRLHALAAQASRIETAKNAQKQVVLERGLQVKRTEKLASRLETELQQDQQKKELTAILEQSVAKGDASFP